MTTGNQPWFPSIGCQDLQWLQPSTHYWQRGSWRETRYEKMRVPEIWWVIGWQLRCHEITWNLFFFDFKLIALFHIRAENFKLNPTGKTRICFCSCESERENFHHKHFTSEIFIVRFGSLSDSGVFWFDMPWWLLKNWVGIFLFPIHQKAGYPTGFPLVFVDFRGSWRFWGNRLVSDVPPVKVLKRQKASKKVHDQAWNIGDNLVLTGSLSRAEGSSLKGGVFVFCGRGNWIE